MTFVLRMAARETRASWHRLLFFFVCIAVGVAAIVDQLPPERAQELVRVHTLVSRTLLGSDE